MEESPVRAPQTNAGDECESFEKPMHKAVITGDLGLFDLKKSVNEVENGQTPLHLSIIKGNTNAAKILITLGANLNTLNKDGYAALHLAVLYDRVALIEDLTDEEIESDVDVMDRDGNTALHIAALMNNANAIKALLEKDADIDVLNEEGNSPLHLAVLRNHIIAVRELLREGADTDLLNAEGNSPLHVAVLTNNVILLDALLGEGADIDISNAQEYSPLHLAVLKENVDLVSKLIREGADAGVENAEGESALRMAVNQGNLDVIRFGRQLFLITSVTNQRSGRAIIIATVDLQATQRLQTTAKRKSKIQVLEKVRLGKFQLEELKPPEILGEQNVKVCNNNDVAVDKNTPSSSTLKQDPGGGGSLVAEAGIGNWRMRRANSIQVKTFFCLYGVDVWRRCSPHH
ncbi:Ankyrin-3 [Araneus ventricosus]|uniref:Ankyrin-3 n=1 Tax=Araneus ventricosus TaxID=182803 RepID=A0A4Y2IL62_ARAVE|nr:Ankyrin-3 [Araneus ventricosus]